MELASLDLFKTRVPLDEPAPARAPNGGPAPTVDRHLHSHLPPPRHKAPSNVANIFNEAYDSMLLKERSMLKAPVVAPLEVEVAPARKPGQSVYTGSLSV